MQPKRILISLLVVMLLTFCTLTAFATTEAASFGVTVSDNTSGTAVKAGDTVEISVTADQWSGEGIGAMTLKVFFDADVMEIAAEDIVAGDAYATSCGTPVIKINAFAGPNKYVDMVVINFATYQGAGEMVKLSFTIKEGGHGDLSLDADFSATALATGEAISVDMGENDGVTTVPVHAYDEGVVTLPNCLEQGYTTYTCTDEGCGHFIVTDYEDALGHDATGADATCTNDKVCAREDCDVVLDEAFGCKAGPNATCVDDQVCVYCGKTITEKQNHLPGPAATCTTAQVCLREGCDYVFQAALGHVPGPAANCEDAQICTREDCGEVLNAALGHAPGAAATCTTAQVCTREDCGKELVAALGHKFNVENASCETAKVCERCDLVETPAIGHNYGEWIVTTEATRKADGVKVQTCGNCGNQITEPVPFEGMPVWAIILIIVGCVLVVAGGCFAVYWFLLKDKVNEAGGFVAYWNSLMGNKPSTESDETTNEESEVETEEATEQEAAEPVAEETTEEKTEE